MKKMSILFLILLIIIANYAMANDEVDIRMRELKELEQKLKGVDSKIETNKSEQYKVISKINAVEGEIRKVDEKIENLNNQISQTETSINNAEKDLDVTNTQLKEKREILEKRIRVMYKTGEVGYAEVLLGSEDFKDLLNRVEIVKKIVKHDKDLIKSIKKDITRINNIKNELANNKKKLLKDEESLKSSKNYLASQQRELAVQKNSLKKNEKALKALEDKLERDANEVTKIIKNLKTKAKYVGGKMGWPAPGFYRTTSPFGYRIHPIYHTKKLHTGLDIGVPWGKSIASAQNGTVIYANWLSSYGKAIMIDHGGGYVTLYAHLSSINVKIGQKVTKGSTIGKCGTTGASTGAHLHFEVRVNGDYVDPMKYLKN